MTLTPQMEQAWLVDEGIRWRESIIKHNRNQYWRKRILDIEEYNLPDQDRPLKVIPQQRKPLRLGRILKSFLP